MLTGSAGRFAIRYGLVGRALDAQAVFDAMYASSPVSFWLDSNLTGADSSRFSFFGDDQGPLCETLVDRGGAVTVRDRRGVRAGSGDIHAILDVRLTDRRIEPTSLPFDFVGGYVGYSSPDRVLAPGVPPTPVHQPPDAMWLFADRIVAVDHQSDLTYVLAVEDGRAGVRVAADAWIVDTMRKIQGLPSQQLIASEPPPIPSLLADQPAADYYRQLRRSQPAPYAALLSFGEEVLLNCGSSSVVRVGVPGGRSAGPSTARRLTAATGAEQIPVSTAHCLLAALAAGVPSEPLIDHSSGLDPARRPTAFGYFGLAGAVDLTFGAGPRVAAVTPGRMDDPLDAAEPVA